MPTRPRACRDAGRLAEGAADDAHGAYANIHVARALERERSRRKTLSRFVPRRAL